MKKKTVNNRANRGLRRTLWEMLTPNALAYSPVIASFAGMDLSAARQGVRDYREGLTNIAIASCCFAWHQTMNGAPWYSVTLSVPLNRAELFLLNELLKFGHQVALNQLSRFAGKGEGQDSGHSIKTPYRAS